MKKRNIFSFVILALAGFTLSSCGEKEYKYEYPTVDTTDDNYRTFYEIFTGSFSDSNGDGIGDLNGIINRLDYLNDGDPQSGNSLGVQGIWLTPIFSSPSYHKYDAMNYYKVAYDFGTNDDLKKLALECHNRNIKLIIDLAINHTSNQHQWFTSFVKAHQENDTTNEFYDYYTYYNKDDLVSGKKVQMIPGTSHKYECNFADDMPELNYDNPKVRDEMLKVAKFWLDLGIDGFRFDAIKYLYYGEDTKNIEFWKWYVGELKTYKPDIYTVGECWSGDNETINYFEALNCFNFQLGQSSGQLTSAAKGKNINVYTKYIENYNKKIKEKNADAMLCGFISNHDMDRAAGYLTPSTMQAQIAANLYLLCSGSPFIYYGEEIGMKGSRGSSNTDANRRLAMLWGDDDKVKNPVGSSFSASKQTNGTVKEQLENENSLLKQYQRLLSLRIKYPEIARGEYTSLDLGSETIGGFNVKYNDSKIAIIHNTSVDEITIDISNLDYKELLEYVGVGKAKLEKNQLTIAACTSVILK